MRLSHILRISSWALSLLTVDFLQAAEPTSTPVDPPAPVAHFADPRLEAAVRRQVLAKRTNSEPLTAGELATVAFLEAPGRGITNLTGLEHCTGLASASLSGNALTDLGPLRGLKLLQYLDLATNKIRDLTPLGTLTGLQYLQLEQNQVTDLTPLAGATNLTSLYLSANRLRLLSPITNLARLGTLTVTQNQLNSLAGVERLPRLHSLSAARNQIKDITPLSGLHHLNWLDLERNRIREIGSLYVAATNDLAGRGDWAPFFRIRLKGNPLSSKADKQVTSLRQAGVPVER